MFAVHQKSYSAAVNGAAGLETPKGLASGVVQGEAVTIPGAAENQTASRAENAGVGVGLFFEFPAQVSGGWIDGFDYAIRFSAEDVTRIAPSKWPLDL